jgi:hypothetical protein
MSTPPPTPPSDLADVAARVPPPREAQTAGLTSRAVDEDVAEKLVDQIEMIGEETAAGFRPPGHSDVTPGMRYLHSSRTIHQLVSDRNRAVGIYLAVATLLWTASSSVLNADAHSGGELLVPLAVIKQWCLPVTFGTLTVLSLFISFLLIRTRIGLIYEVAKMNALLGLPVGRVQRVNVLSLFFIMHLMVSVAGGGCGTLFSIFLLRLAGVELAHVLVPAVLIGIAITALLVVCYVVTVVHTTSDQKLQNVGKG